MTWSLSLGGHTDNVDDERSIIDEVENFVKSLGDRVNYHSMSTTFHGAGTTDVLIHNAESGGPNDPNAGNPAGTSAETVVADTPSEPVAPSSVGLDSPDNPANSEADGVIVTDNTSKAGSDIPASPVSETTPETNNP